MTLAFDIYGTLINPYAIGTQLEELLGSQASAFNQLWRDKQLEYSFRQAAMKEFHHFTQCTRMALDYTDTVLQTQLSTEAKSCLLAAYRELPAYDAVPATLQQLRNQGIEIVAFSNGAHADLLALFQQAQIIDHFDQIISVDEVGTFKPAPEVYALLAEKSNSPQSETYLISTNTFDVIGARAAGLPAIWLHRNPAAVMDPFGYSPTGVIKQLEELVAMFSPE